MRRNIHPKCLYSIESVNFPRKFSWTKNGCLLSITRQRGPRAHPSYLLFIETYVESIYFDKYTENMHGNVQFSVPSSDLLIIINYGYDYWIGNWLCKEAAIFVGVEVLRPQLATLERYVWSNWWISFLLNIEKELNLFKLTSALTPNLPTMSAQQEQE